MSYTPPWYVTHMPVSFVLCACTSALVYSFSAAAAAAASACAGEVEAPTPVTASTAAVSDKPKASAAFFLLPSHPWSDDEEGEAAAEALVVRVRMWDRCKKGLVEVRRLVLLVLLLL